MKKRDIKYIIKRILIGVGIILIVGLFKNNSAHAQTLDLYYDGYTIVSSEPQNSTLVDEFNLSNTQNTYNIHMYFSNTYDYKYIKYYDYNTGSYLYLILRFSDFDYDTITFNINSDNIDSSDSIIICDKLDDQNCITSSFQGNWNDLLVFSLDSLSNLFSTIDYPNSFNNQLLQYNNINYIVNNIMSYSYFYNSNYFSDYQLISSNLQNIIINQQEQEINPILPYYSKLDLSTHEGVYFVPKDYSTVPLITNSIGEQVIEFNYYYQGDFSQGYFPLNNYDMIVFDPYSAVSVNEPSFNSVWFPLQQVIDETIYDYYAYIFEDDYSTGFRQHYDRFIWYDSRYFNYYFIDDFLDYNNSISYIDKNGDSTSSDLSIKSSLRSKFKEGLQDKNVSYITSEILDLPDDIILFKYFDFITIPFNFLRSLMTETTCSPIEIPIPFVGGNLELPCISSVFQNLSSSLFNILVLVINGLLVYRITIRNIDSLTDSLNPDDDKLEVLDL